MSKKVVVKKELASAKLEELTMSDLLAVYSFVKADLYGSAFNKVSGASKSMMQAKMKALEEEIYNRLYGFNPLKEDKPITTITGMVPEQINLNNITPATEFDLEGIMPETFIVAKNKV